MTSVQRAVAVAAAVIGTAFSTFLLLLPMARDTVSDDLAGAVSNVTQLVVPLLVSLVCLDSARRQVDRRQRRTWVLFGLGVGAWGFGQAVFASYELVLGVAVPVPSAADVGFLGFPVLATAAAVYLPRQALSRAAEARSALDGLVIATSLLVVAWATTMRVIWDSGDVDVLALVVTTAYPVGDVMLLTMVLLLLASAKRVRTRVLVPLALGLGAFGVADAGYVYTTSTGTYATGALVDVGWVTGFLLIGVAAVLAHPAAGVDVHAPDHAAGEPTGLPSAQPWSLVLLPYVSLLLAGAVLVRRSTSADPLTTAEIVLATVLVLLVLTRQFVALADNRMLLRELNTKHDEAREQALHDHLTGLGNRALFLDRLSHALALHRRDGGATTVLFCDLDDFKLVNDVHGHLAGDEVLVETARRLDAELRQEDTLARLGGDEFAVLLERSPDPGAVAQRLVAALGAPMAVAGTTVQLSISVGMATVVDEPGVTTDQLLRRADRAMYLVKADGKAGWRDDEGDDGAPRHVPVRIRDRGAVESVGSPPRT